MVARAIKSSQDVSYACRNDDARASSEGRGEMVYCLAGREFISRKKKFNLYFGGPVFSHLT